MSSFIGLQIESESISIAEIQKSFGQWKILKSFSMSYAFQRDTTGRPSRDTLDAALKAIFEQSKISRNTPLVFGMSSKDSIIRFFEMPILPKNERPTAVRFEAQKYISFDIRELYFNYDILLDKTAKKSQVFFVASQRLAVDYYLAALEGMGLKVAAIEPVGLASLRLARSAFAQDGDLVYLLIDLREDSSVHLTVARKNLILISRENVKTAASFENGSLALDQLLQEVQLTSNYFYRNFKNQKIERIYIVNEHVQVPSEWTEKIAGQIGIPVKVVSYGSFFKKNEALSSHIATCVGLGMRQFDEEMIQKLNLLPRESAKRVDATVALSADDEKKLLVKVLSIEGILIIAAVFLSHLLLSARINELRSRSLTPQTTQELESKKLSTIQQSAELETLFKSRRYATEILNRLAALTPEAVVLDRMEYRGLSAVGADESQLRLEWNTKSSDAAQSYMESDNFVSILRKDEILSKYFKEFQLQSQSGGQNKSLFVAEAKN